MKLKFYLLQLIVIFCFTACEKEFPEPNVIEFEKQQVVSNYDWKIISPVGNSQNFITKRNQVIFIYRWSTDNKTDVENLKMLEDFYQKYSTKMEFFFVTNDNQVEVRNFIESNNYTFPVFFSLSPIPIPMNIDKTSKAYLINKKGRIVIENEGEANWNSKKFYSVVEGLIAQ